MAAEIARPIVRASEVQIGAITIPLGKVQKSCFYMNTNEVRIWTMGGMGFKNKEVVINFALKTVEKAEAFFLTLREQWQKENVSDKTCVMTDLDEAETAKMRSLIVYFENLRTQRGPQLNINTIGCFHVHLAPERVRPWKDSLYYSVALDSVVNVQVKERGEDTLKPLGTGEKEGLDKLLHVAVYLAKIIAISVPRLSREATDYATCLAEKLKQFPPRNPIENQVFSNLLMCHPLHEMSLEEHRVLESQMSEQNLKALREMIRELRGLPSISEEKEV